MLLQFFPKTYQNYLNLPIFGPTLKDFSSWCCKRGYAFGTVQNMLKAAKDIEIFYSQKGVMKASELTHELFEQAWQNYNQKPNIRSAVRQIEKFFNEKYVLPPKSPPPLTAAMVRVNRYANNLKDIRGLADKTIKSHVKYTHDFLQFINFNGETDGLQSLTSKEIERFIIYCSKKMNRFSLQHVIGYLRSFLRYEHEKGGIKLPLYAMIDTPRIYRLEQLPRSIPWETVNSLLSTINQNNAHGIRDYTVLYLAASYGLRASEISSLKLNDFHWEKGIFEVPPNKGKKKLTLPITDAAGDVLIHYLKEARPNVRFRELFLHVRAPFGPLTPTGINEIFKRRVRKSGLNIKYGIHSLRHAYAEHLLRQEASIKEIGDLLGHSSLESTCVYLRLAVEDLRDVALSVPHYAKVDAPKNLVLEQYHKKSGNNHKRYNSKLPPKSLNSFLAKDITDYIHLKKSLGRKFRAEIWTLYSFDDFLSHRYPYIKSITPEIFNAWCTSFNHLSPTVRRRRMYILYNFFLYRSRTYPQSFIPDVFSFPKDHSRMTPYIFSELEIARLIKAAKYLAVHPSTNFSFRSETMKIAVLILYTTGIRRCELLNLQLKDFDQQENTLRIRETKFYKNRIVPLSSSTTTEIKKYLVLRNKSSFSMKEEAPIIWNGIRNTDMKSYSGPALLRNFSALCKALKILTKKGKTPRIQDVRHSFACRVLQRWYQQGKCVQSKLPFLSTYMGHVSIISTHYYLKLIEEIGYQSSKRFYESFGKSLIADQTSPQKKLLKGGY